MVFNVTLLKNCVTPLLSFANFQKMTFTHYYKTHYYSMTFQPTYLKLYMEHTVIQLYRNKHIHNIILNCYFKIYIRSFIHSKYGWMKKKLEKC